MRLHLLLTASLCGSLLFSASGCSRSNPREIVIYTAADQDFAVPVFERFEAQSGIHPLGKFDVESTKTVGLVNAIIAEGSRPRCDVFWNNEIMHTMRLRKLGLLRLHESQAGRAYPAPFRSSDGSWYGFGARARILVINRELLSESEWPRSVDELIDPKWKSQVGIAKPLFGTTATHATVLFHKRGADRAQQFFQAVKVNTNVLSGNRQVAIAVARGQLAWGLTDTDDAFQVQQQGYPVEIVFPDQESAGTLVIPNTVAIIKGAPHQEAAASFVDFLLSPQIESSLATGRSAQFPLHPQAEAQSPLGQLDGFRLMDVDFEQAAESWEEAIEYLRSIF